MPTTSWRSCWRPRSPPPTVRRNRSRAPSLPSPFPGRSRPCPCTLFTIAATRWEGSQGRQRSRAEVARGRRGVGPPHGQLLRGHAPNQDTAVIGDGNQITALRIEADTSHRDVEVHQLRDQLALERIPE